MAVILNFGVTRETGMVTARSIFRFAFLEVGSVFWNPVAFLHGSAYYAEINSSKSPSCLVCNLKKKNSDWGSAWLLFMA